MSPSLWIIFSKTLKTAEAPEAPETATHLDILETSGDTGLGNQTRSSPGPFVKLCFHFQNMSA